MNDHDPRCCGSGVCINDPEGRCWCGQQWDGEQMGHAPLPRAMADSAAAALMPDTPPRPMGDQAERG